MKAALQVLSYVFVGCAIIIGAARPAWAQGYAVRSGASINPDQVFVGGQYEFAPVADRVWLQPNADLGFGDDTTLLAMNFDVVYRKSIGRRSTWTAFAGGGPALNWYKFTGSSTTQSGANVVGGVRHAKGLSTEVRLGFLDSPDLRFGVTYTFGRNGGTPRRAAPRRR
ncbi:MAG TPA: hypothetical protein VJ691_18270 [Vicinamibacterales bacterium]|nr:hypothetical protein [Vicinamibacterales bacterium]